MKKRGKSGKAGKKTAASIRKERHRVVRQKRRSLLIAIVVCLGALGMLAAGSLWWTHGRSQQSGRPLAAEGE